MTNPLWWLFDTPDRLHSNESPQSEVQDLTKAERQLREQLTWMQVILTQIGEGIIATDVQGLVTFLNPTAAALTGWPQDEAIGRPLKEVFQASDLTESLPDPIENDARILSSHHKMLKSRDGQDRIIESWTRPIQFHGATFAGAVLAFRDETKRVRAELALQESSQRFERTVNAISDLFAAFDTDWKYVYINEKAAAYSNNKPQDLIGKCVWDVFPDAIGSRTWQEFMEAAATQTIRCFEATYANGRWYEHRVYPHRDGLSLFSTDVTERKQAEDMLRLRDRAINATNQGILIADASLPDNPIIYASPGFERITGYSPSEAIGKNCRFLQGAETDKRSTSRVREAIRRGESCTVEILNYRKDGSPFWNELSISPVYDESNKLTHFVGVQADVTARRAIGEQLRHVQKMESVGRLAGGVAHDFNNMLTVITGCSDIVLKCMPEDDSSYELLKEIKIAGDRAASLTKQLLAFSRQQLIMPQVLDLNEVVSHTQTMLRRLISEDIGLAMTLQPNLPVVRADRGQLEQILVNLAVNARDAMPKGGELRVATFELELDEHDLANHVAAVPGTYVVLEVADNGCGFDPELIDRLFEPFFTTKAKGQGTGLGLAVVHGIVTQAGGFIDVHTEEKKGSRFRIHWPAVHDDVEAAETREDRVEGVLERGTETVLLVEDEPGLRAFARTVLTQCGYKVLEAVDGTEAVKIASCGQSPINLLVTDVVMPVMGGREVAAAFRYLHPSAAVLFMSGYTDDAVVRNGIYQDEVDFIQKPFSPSKLACKVRQVLDGTGHSKRLDDAVNN